MQNEMDAEALRAHFCKRVMAALRSEGEALGLIILASCRTTKTAGSVHLSAMGIGNDEKGQQDVLFVADVVVREPHRE